MSKYKRSKDKLWGSGAMNDLGTMKFLDINKAKEINDRIYMMSKDHYCVNRDYELKDWQIELMTKD